MIEPDTKDWTWVLDAPCPDCGFVAAHVDVGRLGDAIRSNAALWSVVLSGPGATDRPDPGTWSPTEYAAHVRDVHRVFAERVALMLAEDGPVFANWDQDATALEQRYDLADPAETGPALTQSAEDVATLYDGVRPDQRDRTGLRSNGSAFTIDTLARYHLHDVVHHTWDVRRQLAVAAYDRQAADYRTASAPLGDGVRAGIDELAARLAPGSLVLEIGSGGGRDALELETRGLRVRRTDVATGFVTLLREAGHDADVLDPLTDDLSPAPPDTAYDAVWANASLLHVARTDLPVVLARLALVTRPGGVLRAAVKEGDGEGWSTHGSIAVPRMFTYWRRPDLESVVTGSGWDVVRTDETSGRRDERWLSVLATRRLP
ncbi:class I SAM-dependent methyltransferase [Nocardioides plantarum]|uniref:Class I SAM-dependent methyltransferase n=1 Tax=Nocardioides plantarum TaxID=29299 RepID=A0ABV5KE99_9ACTN|nr:class I SAM-dependent methyltransferase [Nocardioides plantarum]